MTESLAKDTPPEYVVLDFETTGFDESQAEIIEIGALRVKGLEVLDRYHSLVRASAPIPPVISRLTGIRDEDVRGAPQLSDVLPGFLDFVRDLPLVAHNATLEQRFLDHQIAPRASVRKFTVHNSIDPLALVLPERPSLSLESLRQWAGLPAEGAHRADHDCEATLRVLERAQEYMRTERPWLAGIVQSLLGSEDDPWWWAWFFAGDTVSLPEKAPLGDLRELRGEDAAREPDWTKIPGPEAVHRALSHEIADKFRYRETQEKMAQLVRETLAQGGRVAVEAPTGTGKSLAYLVPGLIAARASGAPLVVATHSKSLQDQLLEKDIPLARQLISEAGRAENLAHPGGETGDTPSATTVKGQENYLCLRKLHDHVDAARSGSLEERWSAAYLQALSVSIPTVELDRVSHYLKTQFPALAAAVDSVKSHHTTTLGPPCPHYKRCHFFDSARLAHRADVIVANHALTFQWPAHLPQIRSIVFDEAHHLEEQITEAHRLELSEGTLQDHVHRLDGRTGSGVAGRSTRARQSSRRTGDAPAIARFVEGLVLQGSHGEAMKLASLEERCEAIRARAGEVRMAAPRALARDVGDDGFEQPIVLGPPLPPQARDPAPRPPTQAVGALAEALRNLQGEVRRLAEALTAALTAGDSPSNRQNPAFDQLKTHAFRFSQDADRLASVVDATDANRLRVVHWDPRESTWRVSAEPIQVTGLAEPFFAARHGVVLTSATLATGGSASFVVDRIGLAPTRPPVILPSPFRLDRQATVFITEDAPPPGSPPHLEAITRFTEKAALALGGRTLLLLTANRRLRLAAQLLRERLTPHGIEVFDSLSDRRAAEAFRMTERAVLVGGERYGEGLDIPGRALSLVVLEKINEAMTRGPLAEARKARTKFSLYDYDFPLRMMWLKQRVGRLIRTPTDSGWVVVFDPRYMAWGASSRAVVNRTLAPMPVRALPREDILAQISSELERSG